MKKLFYSLFAAAMLLATSSCSNEEELIPSGKNEGVEVSFQLALDDAASSRALTNELADDTYGKGKRVDNVIAAVYSNGMEIESLRKPVNTINQENLTCNVTFRLIEGQTYDFVFWAEKTGTDFYNTTDLKAIKVNYAGDANDENRDAFTAVRKGLRIKNGGMSEKIVLTRPFAQLNIASTDEDHGIAEAAGFGCDMLTSKIYIMNVYDTFDAYNERPSGSADINFNLAAVPGNSTIGEVLKQVKGKNDTEGQDYKGYLSMNYFLAEAGSSQNVDVVAHFESSSTGAVPVEISVPHVPVRRNYRTNIIGNILTEQVVFNIVIDPNFKTPDYVVGWDGKTVAAIEPNAEGIYEVSSASQLAWIAKQVNDGTNNFDGKTLKLMEDIDLGGQLWTPIGWNNKNYTKHEDKVKFHFCGIFDGNGKTVRNYSVNADEYTGLFGVVGHEATIMNVTVANATIIGHHFGGALAAWVQSTDKNHTITIKNCHAKNVTVTLTPDANKDNGNQAGGLIGYTVRTNLINCTVDNALVTAYRDCGGLIGCANDNTMGNDLSVTNSTIIADQTVDYIESGKAANAGEITGRRGSPVSYTSTSNNVEVIVRRKMDAEIASNSLSTGFYLLDGFSVNATDGNALTLKENANVTIEVKGNVLLTGAASGISVPAGATLTLQGNGNLVVEGQNGSGISVGAEGSIIIDGLKNLTAKGNGNHAFGIGGNGANVTIKDSQVDYVCGGHIQPLCINDPSYGKSEPEGGSAIGGAVILLDGATIVKADGGSKAAGIGAQYWQSTNITIKNSTIKEVNGGNASAGIGGSRYASGITAENKQIVKIKIENSTVKANGGQFGAGIGAGYDTHCAANETNAINDIQIVESTITATGGKYAAGIGSGYHSAALTGSIDAASTITATAGESREKYTIAQKIGYGVINKDEGKEGYGLNPTFIVAGKVIENPNMQ